MKTKNLLPVFLIIGVSLPVMVQGQQHEGALCTVKQVRITNTNQKVVKSPLWEFNQTKIPDSPIMGFVDAACADRGKPRHKFQEFGKRIWFSVSGPEGGAANEAQLFTDTAQLTGKEENSGLAVEGLTIYSVIMERHDCIYTVKVWKDSCDKQ